MRFQRCHLCLKLRKFSFTNGLYFLVDKCNYVLAILAIVDIWMVVFIIVITVYVRFICVFLKFYNVKCTLDIKRINNVWEFFIFDSYKFIIIPLIKFLLNN